jgi:hypothetical protein
MPTDSVLFTCNLIRAMKPLQCAAEAFCVLITILWFWRLPEI